MLFRWRMLLKDEERMTNSRCLWKLMQSACVCDHGRNGLCGDADRQADLYHLLGPQCGLLEGCGVSCHRLDDE